MIRTTDPFPTLICSTGLQMVEAVAGTVWQFADQNGVLGTDQIGVELDAGLHKVGDGSTAWNALGYTGTASLALSAADIPSLAASKITSGTFNIARLATGTPTGSKFVRDDGVLAVPTPATDPLVTVIARQQYR